jgi:outer membrane protein, heavy metal efflux system
MLKTEDHVLQLDDPDRVELGKRRELTALRLSNSHGKVIARIGSHFWQMTTRHSEFIMTKRIIELFILLLSTCGAWAADLPSHPLTLLDAVTLARQNNLSLSSARVHASAIQAGEVAAALRPNPVFNSASQDFNVFQPSKLDPTNGQEFTNSLAWTIERGGKRDARIQDSRLVSQVAQAGVNDGERQLDLQVKLAFVSLLLNTELLKLAEENLHEYGQVIDANQLRWQAGDISETDFDRIKIEEARFQSDGLSARTATLQARSQLATLLGISDSARVEIQGELAAPATSNTLDELRRAALAYRPDYAGALRSTAKAEADTRLARANGAADLTVSPEYKRNGPDNTIGLTFSVPVRIFDRNQGEKLRAKRDLESSRLAEQAARLQVLADVQQAWDAYQAAAERQKLYSDDYLKRSQSVLERMTFSYQHGAASLLDYLDALRSHRDVSLGAVTANAQALSALHQLSFASATELLP